MATRTDKTTTKPSTVAPGDAPHDTTDPAERVSSVPVHPDAEAVRAGTVNAVLLNPNLPSPRGVEAAEDDRLESYDAVRPDGTKVTVTRNLETGESTVSAHPTGDPGDAKSPRGK